MEHHRLKPMKEYDVKLFNELYSKTEGLRRKLSSQIDPHRFNLQQEDILSWFNDKFIFVFDKYHDKMDEELLLGHLIKGMQLFKCRILRSAYTFKNSQKVINVEDTARLEDSFIEEDSNPNTNYYYNKLSSFMKGHLSDNAFYLFELQLNPPPYILTRINKGTESKKLDKIPDELILDYFGIPQNKKTLRYILGLKEEIKFAVDLAKATFRASV